MGTIVKLNTVQEYNIAMGVETLHPLVSVVDFSTLKSLKHGRKNFGFYCVFLKQLKCGELSYGRSTYDYQEGTLGGCWPFIPICYGVLHWDVK